MPASINTLVTFNGIGNGAFPQAGLISDAAGDLFGTTYNGGANSDGTVFEIAKTASGYAAPVTLVTFDGPDNGSSPYAGLISDAAGDLFGTTYYGGVLGSGTVFEIAKTASGYGAPVTLVTFNGLGNGSSPYAGLISDAAGDLFGTTTNGGANSDGTVFEIANSASGYGAPVTLATFNGTGNGNDPVAGLISDAVGDLFGTTYYGGQHGDGTVFEIANSASGYGPPLTLVTFDGPGNGAHPDAGLISDTAGDLFGTTQNGGSYGYGTVFEIAKTALGYGAPVTLASFAGPSNGGFPYDGAYPYAGLISDAAGDLFGTTYQGGTYGYGTVFEIAKTASGYGSSVTLVSFDGVDNGAYPHAGLISDAAGDLFSTTYQGGQLGDGTVFEITGSGFFALAISSTGGSTGTRTQTISGTIDAADAGQTVSIYDGSTLIGTATPSVNGAWSTTVNLFSTLGAQSITAQATDAEGVVGTSSPVTYTLLDAVAADFTGSGTSDVLWINPTSDIVGDWLMNQGTPTWHVVGQGSSTVNIEGFGDFAGNGTSDILWENPSNGVVGDWLMNNNQPAWHQIGQGSTTMNIAGVGDFNSDGTSDILWQNPTNNYVGIWQMQNNVPTWEAVGYGSTTMNIVGIGDFTGSEKDDILWENPTNNLVGMWVMNGSQATWSLIAQGSTTMNIVGIGDFTGNGTDDILWENPTNGTVGFWAMNYGYVNSWNVVATANTSYQVAGIGDYDGNGTEDILWRNASTGDVGVWAMNNGQATWHDLGISSTSFNTVKA